LELHPANLDRRVAHLFQEATSNHPNHPDHNQNGNLAGGAIATYAPTGILGVATDQASKSEAEQEALLDCKLKGGPICKIEVAYDNECAAVVVGDKGYNVNTDTTVDAAVRYGLKTCSNMA
jgi:hypothetical protein